LKAHATITAAIRLTQPIGRTYAMCTGPTMATFLHRLEQVLVEAGVPDVAK